VAGTWRGGRNPAADEARADGSGSGTSGVPVIHRRPKEAPGVRLGVAELKVAVLSSTGAPLCRFPRLLPARLGACKGGGHRTGQHESHGRLG
jgi:hypothetical protein